MRRLLSYISLLLLPILSVPLWGQRQENQKMPEQTTGISYKAEGRTMSPAERLWRTNYNPDRLPPQLRNTACMPEGKHGTLSALAKAASGTPVPYYDDFWINILATETDDDVFALAADGNTVYAGGAFKNFVGVQANGIAVWNGSEWSPILDGSAIGVDGFVFAIAVSGSNIYVGGQFTKAGNVPANNIAVWNKQTKTWSALGEGITGNGVDIPFVSAIKVDGEDIYVGGQFTRAGSATAGNIARWDGGSWSPVGSGINGTVNALEVFQNNLYVGGSFSGAGDVSSVGIIMWDGTDWQSLAGGVVGFVNEIKASGDSGVVVGGNFTILTAEGTTARNIAWWSGSWINRGGRDPFGFPGQEITIAGEVRSIVVEGRDMWVGGVFDDAFPREAGAGTGPLSNVVLFNDQPATWFRLPEGVNSAVNALTKTGRTLFAGGSFTRTGTKEANRIARWDTLNRVWIGVQSPAALAPIRAMALHKGKLYAAGTFEEEKPGLFNATNRLAELTPKGWQLIRGDIKGSIYSLSSAGDELIIGGSFITTDEQITVNAARWNSTTQEWNALTPGSGVAGLDDISYITTIMPDGDNIYVGGLFGIADTMTARNIACWNRQTESWRALGEGVNGKVWAIAHDPQGNLYVGGEFTQSGNTTVNGIARWDGSSWQAMGTGVEGSVQALLFAEGKLYVGGRFRKAGGVDAINVALWNPTTAEWSNLGPGVDGQFQAEVNALAYNRGKVVAAGKFDVCGGDSVHNIAWWNAEGGWWASLGSGTDRLVQALAVDEENNRLYVGGAFLMAGCKDSPYTALWRDPTLSVDPESIPGPGGMLAGSAPNPFTSAAIVRLIIPEGKNSTVSLVLCDLTGRTLRTLIEGSLSGGTHEIQVPGDELPSGAYFLRLQSGEEIESIPIIRQ